MKVEKLFAALAGAFLLVAAPLGAAWGEDLIVEHNAASGHYETIQAAIDHAATVLAVPNNTRSFRIRVKADSNPYTLPFTPIRNVPIIGDSTSGTFIEGNGSGPIVNIAGVSGITIRNFTFRNATLGIRVTGSSDINITNNVFQLGPTAVAVSITGSTGSIVNNTFVGNGTALAAGSDVTVSNNIFFQNSTAISAQSGLTALSYNFFNANNTNGVTLEPHSIPNTQVPNQNPLFVDQTNRDYHLQSGSAAKGAGNPNYTNSFDQSSDMGAYGGPNADAGTGTVTGVTSELSAPDTVTVRWNAAGAPATAYRVYYGTASRSYSGVVATEGASPLTVTFPATSAVLSGLTLPVPTAPAAPAAISVSPYNRALLVSWSASAGATGYRIYYAQSDDPQAAIDPASASHLDVTGGGITSTMIPGLSNGTRYSVAVAALTQNRIFAAVTAVVDAALASAPGSGNESPYSVETSVGIGPVKESALSQQLNDFPEASVAFPDFKAGTGCFIATAAYGSYLAPQVQLLRKFRDGFLLTNAPGRAFVGWYYHYGPYGARFINEHPWLKVPVRLALLPLIALAAFCVCAPPALQAGLLVCALALTLSLYLKNRRSWPGVLNEVNR